MNFGTVSVLIVIIASWFRRDERRKREYFLTAMGFAALIVGWGQLPQLLIQMTPYTYDEAFLRYDHWLGFDTMRVADLLGHYRYLMAACYAVYILLPVAMAVAWIIEQNKVMRRGIVIGATLCWVFFASVPAVGPVYYNLSSHSAAISPRNCLPSMHLSWVLLLAWNARRWMLKIGLWVFAGLTLIATIGLREHYLVDLIAAIPFTIGVQWLAKVACEHGVQFINTNEPLAGPEIVMKKL